jgi:hypothetical protein
VARVPLPAPASIGLRGDLTAAERWRLAWSGLVWSAIWPRMTKTKRRAIWFKRIPLMLVVGMVVGLIAWSAWTRASELWPFWAALAFLICIFLPAATYLTHLAGPHQVIYLSPCADVMLRVATTKKGTWRIDQHVKLPGAEARALRLDVLDQLLPIAREQGVRVTLTAAGESLAKRYAADFVDAQLGHPAPVELKRQTPRVLGIPVKMPFTVPMVWKA